MGEEVEVGGDVKPKASSESKASGHTWLNSIGVCVTVFVALLGAGAWIEQMNGRLRDVEHKLENLPKVVQGERGPEGLRGEKGERGERGEKGEPGERGERGLEGASSPLRTAPLDFKEECRRFALDGLPQGSEMRVDSAPPQEPGAFEAVGITVTPSGVVWGFSCRKNTNNPALVFHRTALPKR